MTLVVDANVALAASVSADGFDEFAEQLCAPPLMWSEGRSALHEALWRRDLGPDDVEALRMNLERCPVELVDDRRLGEMAWDIAGELGVAKTYDAEYLALARLLGGRVVTLNMRLRHGADRLGLVITPGEL